jgi:hypothetical protein
MSKILESDNMPHVELNPILVKKLETITTHPQEYLKEFLVFPTGDINEDGDYLFYVIKMDDRKNKK